MQLRRMSRNCLPMGRTGATGAAFGMRSNPPL